MGEDPVTFPVLELIESKDLLGLFEKGFDGPALAIQLDEGARIGRQKIRDDGRFSPFVLQADDEDRAVSRQDRWECKPAGFQGTGVAIALLLLEESFRLNRSAVDDQVPVAAQAADKGQP